MVQLLQQTMSNSLVSGGVMFGGDNCICFASGVFGGDNCVCFARGSLVSECGRCGNDS